MMIQKLTTACRYGISPARYPFLWRKAIGRALGAPASLEDTAEQSIKWCRRHLVSNADAIKIITGRSALASNIEERFPAEMRFASAAVEACPQRMGGGANMALLHDLVSMSGATSIIETGVAYGWSSLAVLLALQEMNGARLVSTNLHYREYDSDTHVGCTVPAHLRDQWTIIPEPDNEAVPEAIAKFPHGIDLCHYDSDKSYAGRLQSYPLLWMALKPGGIMVSDDIQDNLAFAHFAKMAGVTPVITDANDRRSSAKFVGIMQKKMARPLRQIQF